MVKIVGPLLSQSATGTLSKLITYLPGKGIQIARALAKRRAPDRVDQLAARTIFAFLAATWKEMTTAQRLTWLKTDDQEIAAARLEYFRFNLLNWRSYLPPSRSFPPDRSPSTPTVAFYPPIQWKRGIYIYWLCLLPIDVWGAILSLRASPGDPPAWHNLRAFKLFSKSGYDWLWSGKLPPGTYYTTIQTVNHTGGPIGPPTSDEITIAY